MRIKTQNNIAVAVDDLKRGDVLVFHSGVMIVDSVEAVVEADHTHERYVHAVGLDGNECIASFAGEEFHAIRMRVPAALAKAD